MSAAAEVGTVVAGGRSRTPPVRLGEERADVGRAEQRSRVALVDADRTVVPSAVRRVASFIG